MANLSTPHDRYHVHKTLGFICLLHFIYRFAVWAIQGSAFPQGGSKFDVLMVAVHIVLQASSFLLPVPANRNFSAPMIWREFRIHNAIFGMRNLLLTLIMFAEDEHRSWPFAVLKWIVLVASLRCADLATERYGDKTNRTINTLPFPHDLAPSLQQSQREFYSFMQFGAAAVCFVDVSATFCAVLGIQGASFLMTLVRKGKIESRHMHFFYGLFLWINMALFNFRSPQSNADLVAVWVSCLIMQLAFDARTKHGGSKYAIWTVAALCLYLIPSSCPLRHFLPALLDSKWTWIANVFKLLCYGKIAQGCASTLWVITCWPLKFKFVTHWHPKAVDVSSKERVATNLNGDKGG